MILSSHVSDEKIFLFFSLLGNSIPNLVRLSGRRRMTFQFGATPLPHWSFEIQSLSTWQNNDVSRDFSASSRNTIHFTENERVFSCLRKCPGAT
jgi:hypothetical protein